MTSRIASSLVHVRGLDATSYMDAYTRGWTYSGRPSASLDDNPFPPRTPEEDAWEDGYMDRAVGRPKWSTPREGIES